ncbi:hypothetical protein CVT26_002825 [Gymnopilus dilepis]|uniref:Uncharacterized protein n=1 Tax=Gymnopilus dilepis TaxID=231916 RepID=A0A409Y386_9AGAR|nr:hypothetical protein CVT26_002825 [Gymnopilus dilepis]
MTDLRVEDDSKYYREDGGDSRFASCSGQWRASKCVYTTGRVLAGREANAKDETGRRSQGDVGSDDEACLVSSSRPSCASSSDPM